MHCQYQAEQERCRNVPPSTQGFVVPRSVDDQSWLLSSLEMDPRCVGWTLIIPFMSQQRHFECRHDVHPCLWLRRLLVFCDRFKIIPALPILITALASLYSVQMFCRVWCKVGKSGRQTDHGVLRWTPDVGAADSSFPAKKNLRPGRHRSGPGPA